MTKKQPKAPVYKPRAIEVVCRGFGDDKKECLKRDECLRFHSFFLGKKKGQCEMVYCVSLTNTVECRFFIEELSGE